HAARHALPAGFVPEEGRDAEQQVVEVHRIVDHQEHTGAQCRLRGARALERERHVQLVRPNEDAGRTAQEHGLQLFSTRYSTREPEQLLRGRAERELVESRTLDTSTDTKQARAGGLLRSDLCELRASFAQ